MKTWVVTGGRGFLGQALIAQIVSQGDAVWVVDAGTYAAGRIPSWWETSGLVHYQEADVATLERLPDADVVVHAAAETHVDNSIGDASPFLHSNVQGTQRILDLIRGKRTRPPVLIQISTDEVYGSNEGPPTPTHAPLRPRNPYAASKAGADLLVQAAVCTHGLDAMILRMTNLYGIGQYPEKLIPKAVRLLSRGQSMPIHGDGSAKRSWLHVEDAVRAIICLGDRGSSGAIYHANGNTEASVMEIVEHIAQIVGLSDACDPFHERPGLDQRYALDDTGLREKGWQSRGDFWRDLPQIVDEERRRSPWA